MYWNAGCNLRTESRLVPTVRRGNIYSLVILRFALCPYVRKAYSFPKHPLDVINGRNKRQGSVLLSKTKRKETETNKTYYPKYEHRYGNKEIGKASRV